MADSESKMEVQEETLKGSNKSVALNGHSTMLENKMDNSNHKSKLENGEVECQSPQVNGDVSDKSALDDCELPKSEKTKSDNSCINNDSSNEPNNSDSIPENGKVEKKDSTDSVVKSKDSDITNNVHKTLNNSEKTESVNSTSNDTPNSEDIKSDKESGNDNDKVKTEKKIEPVVQSVDKTNDISSDNQPSTEEKPESKVTENEENKSKEEKSDDKMDVDLKSSEEVKEDTNKDKDVTIAEGDEAKKSDESSKTEECKTEASPSKEKKGKEKTPKKKDDLKIEIVKRVTRSSSGITKPVKYLDPDPRDIIDDDDDIRITKEVKKKDEDDDIEMIEESDPLAISDADVKKAKEANKGPHNFQERLKSFKQREISSHKGKDSNVIIIDTNTLLKSGGQSGMSQSSMVAKAMNSVSAQTTTTTNATTSQNANIQTAIQAITGGNPAIQGLQSAYLNAIQQVLVAQGNQASNPHYIATLQQYYNTLGALQDDAYVIEAPSFIVPYVMEGKPIESIKDYQERLKKEIEEEEGKKLKEEKEKEKGKDKENKEKDIAVIENKEKDIAEKEIEKDASKDKEGKEKKDKKTDEDEKMDVDEVKEIKEDGKTDKEDKKEEEKKTKDAEEKMDIDEDEKIEKPETEAKKEKDEKKIEDKETGKSKAEDKETDKSKAEDKEIAENKVEEKEIDIIEEKDKDVNNKTEDKDNKTEDKSKIDEKDKDKSKMKEKSEDDNKENKSEKKESGKEEEVIDLESEGKEDLSHLGRWESYYKSSLGKFFLELGLNHAQEFIQADLLKMQKRRVEKLKTNPTKQDVIAIKTLERQLNVTKAKNAHLFLPMKICRFCSYKTESELVMERHLESPHMVNYTYKCNFCEFETRGPQVILFHTEAEHNVRGRLERAPAFFQCPLCPFEDNNKSKMTRHSFSCSKKYKADKNCDLTDWEPPAKIPKIHRGGRPNFSGFGKTFDGLKMPNILPKNLGGLSLNLQNAISSGLLNSAAMASANSLAGRGRGRPVGSYKNITQTVGNRPGSLMYQNRGSGLLQPMQGVSPQQLSIANQVLQSVTQGGSNRVPRILPASSAGSLLPGLAASSSITIQSVQNKSGNTKSPQQPSISITPLPRGGSQSSGNKPTPTNASSNSSSQRPAFVICEICDGYIKDLEQLRNHMNLIHKVKIHPKMIYNRPPLNCQKCQQRFFTDQGLERHLLGTHGLVTSSMQEAANKGKDAGRCPICGKVFQWKLLNHVSRDHKMTLKPAHLSYKCTVCTATFNMYRLFENHVYSAHSVVNKNKNAEGSSSTASSTPAKKPAPVAASTDSTPLKINDEITIIPQPATKSPNPKSESKSTVSPKKSDSPSMSKEITITKVGSRSSSRRSGSSSGSGGGGGVEVISLDDSPQKRQVEETPSKKRTRDTATSKRARTS